jgi:phage recombination protein Bet
MNTSLAVVPEPPAPFVTPAQLDLIKATVARDATDAELALYLFDCQRRGVHPLDRLIHFTKRAGKYTPITSIDFMRTRAATTGECAGIEDAQFTDGPESPATFRATVTVWRLVQGQRCAFTATAWWQEFRPEQNDFMWRRMPHVMLGKVAEGHALRKGFPQQLAGLYAAEEMDQAREDGEAPPRPAGKPDKPITAAQRKRLFAIAKDCGVSEEALRAALPPGVESTKDLTQAMYEAVITRLQTPGADDVL